VTASAWLPVALLTIAPMQVFGTDNSLGTWKLDVTTAEYSTPGYGLASETIVREESPNGVKHTVTKVRKDGTSAVAGYTCRYDGAACPGTGTAWAFNSVKQVDSNTFSYTGSSVPPSELGKGKASHMSGRMVISNDGQTMTLTESNTTGAGQTAQSTRVYKKQH
jgi:hypothetical protein